MKTKVGLLLAILFLSCLICENTAWARRRGGSSRGNAASRIRALQATAQANIAVASNILRGATAAGMAAESKINEARGIASDASDKGKNAKDAIKSEHEHMREIEDTIANAQAQDSEFIKALDAYEDASDEYHDTREKILNSTEYKIRYERAVSTPGSSDRQKALDELKYDMFTSNREFTGAVGVLENTKSKFEKIRMELLSSNSDWMDAAKAVREARVSEADSKDRLTAAGLKKMDAGQKFRSAKEVAIQAQQVIAANQAVLNSLPKQKGTTQTKPATKK